MPHLFRFGMQLVMPGRFDRIDYYGRGPVENYDDRNESQRLGRYRQLVKDQYYPYIRPQESGTKSDIRWWKLTDIDGRGLAIRSDVPFSASALNYLPEDLDDGWDKDQRHSGELKPRGLTTLSFDLTCRNTAVRKPIRCPPSAIRAATSRCWPGYPAILAGSSHSRIE